MEEIWNYILANEHIVQKIILSDTMAEIKKIIVHKTLIRGKTKWQIERYKGAQVFHENVDFDKLNLLPFEDYKQITVELVGKTGIFSKTKSSYKLKEKLNQTQQKQVMHNKQKSYFINEGDDVPALIDLGIFTKEHKIVASMYDKFKQINK